MKIAIVGAGISGLVAAHLLNEGHDITLFEANDYIGGHTRTVDVARPGGKVAVDTGFIVFNARTYPNFVRLMKSLGVAWQPSEMSFSVQCERSGLIFSPSSLASLFAQRKNLVRPGFYRMLADALRFRRRAAALIEEGHDQMTLAAYLKKENYGRGFIEHFIIPMGAAIWSADPARFMDFPARLFATFFYNHGFLEIRDQPQWLTIKGGSNQYIAPLTRRFREKIRLNTPVRSVRRHDAHVELATPDGTRHRFDQVVIATHSDQALGMLADPSPAEKEILGAIGYQENLTVLHSDVSLMPALRAAWASWNYRIPRKTLNRVALTYHMNRLQNLRSDDPLCVTLNMADAIDPAKKIAEIVYHHPIYDPASLAARRRREEINGVNRTWYCGAYWGYGFHEDGVNSALAVIRRFGIKLQ